MASINKQDFLFFLKEGCTLKELAEVFECSEVTISRYKKSLNLQRASKAPKIINNTKKCTQCLKIKSIDSYYKDQNNKLTGLRASCIECMNEKAKKHYEKNVDLYAEKHLKYKWSKKNAVPSWYSELDSLILEEMYNMCNLKEQFFGIKYHVDHILPLQGETVCGLHWHKNWQVIPAKENLSKSNKLLEKYING